MANMHHDTAAAANVTPLPAIPVGARVTFSNLRDGQSVSSPFKVQFKIEGMRLDTAGPVVAGSGHHHLLVDAEDSIPAGTVVAKDANHLHFGKGQTETELTLPPGKHKLTLQYADGIHRSYGGQLAKTITVTVH
ncbi:MAG: rod shape-determining protein RodA [Bacteroidetes bacterium]|nr:MAG: rod shape-determining protein RodA [Bacteroidota bacterium]